MKWDGFICNNFSGNANFEGTDIPCSIDGRIFYDACKEAEVRLSKAAPTASAISAVNEVRNRAGLGVIIWRYIILQMHFYSCHTEERGTNYFMKKDVVRLIWFVSIVMHVRQPEWKVLYLLSSICLYQLCRRPSSGEWQNLVQNYEKTRLENRQKCSWWNLRKWFFIQLNNK